MSAKLLSLFSHPEFVKKTQARAERELAEQVVPVIDLGRGRFRCRRCSLDFDSEIPAIGKATTELCAPCPQCDPAPDFDVTDAFLAELFREP